MKRHETTMTVETNTLRGSSNLASGILGERPFFPWDGILHCSTSKRGATSADGLHRLASDGGCV